MSELTPSQRSAVQAQGPVVVVAGAGSGKTTVLVERYLQELARIGDPARILALSFTVEAADQLRERVEKRLGRDGASEALLERVARTPWIGTIHSFCFSVLSDFGPSRSLAPIREILTSAEFLWEWKRHFTRWLDTMETEDLREGLRYWDRREWEPLAKGWCQQRWAWNRGAQTQPIPESERAQWHWMEKHFGRLHRELLSTTRDQGRYSFSELETLTLDILENHPAASARLQQRFDAILVDEFQDTSRLQWEILSRLAQPREKLFLVGDPKQSIYGFRGADVEVFFEVHRSLQDGQGTEVELGENFRTGRDLLERINAKGERLFANSPFPFHPLVPQIQSPSVFELHRTDPRDEVSRIADLTRQLIEQGNREEDIAILVRVSEPMVRLEAQLRRRGIRTAAVSGGDLQKRHETRLLSAYLRALDDPLDELALAGFLCAWGWDQAQLWSAKQSAPSLFEAVQKTPSLAWFVNLVETGESDWTYALEVLLSVQGATAPSEVRFTWVQALSGAPTLADAVDRLDAWEKESLPLEGAGGVGVRLLTVHGAKGLEFPHVLLGDLNRQPPRNPPPLITDPAHPPGYTFRRDGEKVPSTHFETLWEKQQKREKEESLRVLYVAMTRAKHSLHCFVPENPDKIRKGSWAHWLTDDL